MDLLLLSVITIQLPMNCMNSFRYTLTSRNKCARGNDCITTRDQTPTINTVAVSGIVCFITKTLEYLENISRGRVQDDYMSNTRDPRKKNSIQREKENHTRKVTYADEGKKD